jgi:hypothetical protein
MQQAVRPTTAAQMMGLSGYIGKGLLGVLVATEAN